MSYSSHALTVHARVALHDVLATVTVRHQHCSTSVHILSQIIQWQSTRTLKSITRKLSSEQHRHNVKHATKTTIFTFFSALQLFVQLHRLKVYFLAYLLNYDVLAISVSFCSNFLMMLC